MCNIIKFAGVTTLFQAVSQIVLCSLSIAQYYCVIDFLREVDQLIFIKIIYYLNTDNCGNIVNIGNAVEGVANQAFVMFAREPPTSTRTFIFSCTHLGLGCAWALASCLLLAGAANNKYSMPLRWPWITVTICVCAVDLVAVVTYINDSFHTRTLNDMMRYIGGTVSGIGGASINTSATSWIMVVIYSRCFFFFIINVVFTVLVALYQREVHAKAVLVESAETQYSRTSTPPPMLPPVVPQQIFPETHADRPSTNNSRIAPNVKKSKDKSTMETVRTVDDDSTVSTARDLDEISIYENNEQERAWYDIPRAYFSRTFQKMKKNMFTKDSSVRSKDDTAPDFSNCNIEKSPEMSRILVWLQNNIFRVTVQDKVTSSISNNANLNLRQGRPSLPIGWLVLSAIISRSPRARLNPARSVNFPHNLLSLPQRMEVVIANQQQRIDKAVHANASSSAAANATTSVSMFQSLPALNDINEEAGPSFNRSRRNTAADLQRQKPWSYIPAASGRMRDQLPSDEDLPPVPLPDYTVIAGAAHRKASVHRAPSKLSNNIAFKYHHKKTDVLY